MSENHPPADMTVRLANAADVAAIHTLLTQLADGTGQRHKLRSKAADLFKHGFSEHPAFYVLLAERAGAVLGLSLFLYLFSSWRGELGVYVQDLVVDRSARAGGVGRVLIRETVRHAKQRGATHLRLSVERDNAEAIRFYRRIGLRASDGELIFEAGQVVFERLAASS
jgi:ribosomal protein S18 acetylase RimI-like enzyme